jgi:hypothetical protein
MTAAIGMKGRGQGIQRISSHKALKEHINNDLAVAIETPITFDSGSPIPTAGYEADILRQVCEAVLDAKNSGDLKTEQELRYAQFCDILIRAFAKVGIVALVDEATGYQEIRDRQALQAILDKYITDEWAKQKLWRAHFCDLLEE